MAVTVYRYGLRTRADGEFRDPADPEKGRDSSRYELPQEVRDQLRLAHEMRNEMTAAELDFEARRKAVWSQRPEVAAVEERLAAAEEEAAGLAAQAKAGRSADRTIATRPEVAKELRAAQARATELRQARRDAITLAYPSVKPKLEALKAEQKAAEKACRQAFAAKGLYWATYNMVIADHRVTVKLVDQRRKAHLPAAYRFRRWQGAGTIGVQLQRQNGIAAVTTLRVLPRGAGVFPGELPDLSKVPVPAGAPEGTSVTTALAPEADGNGVRTGYWTLTVTARNTVDAPAAVTVTADLGELLKVAAPAGEPEVAGPGYASGPAGDGILRWAGTLPAGKPFRTPDLLADEEGSPWRNVLTLTPWIDPAQWEALPRAERRRLGRTGQAGIAVGGGKTVELPVAVHRMLPVGADVCEATLTVERVAGQWGASLCVTAKVPGPDPAEGRPAVALHCGWRSRPDGSVRVAAWGCDQPLQVPPYLAEGGAWPVLLPRGDGRAGEVVVPARWLDAAGYAPAVQGTRDTAADALRKKLASAMREDPLLAAAATAALREGPAARLAAKRLDAARKAWDEQGEGLWEDAAQEAAALAEARAETAEQVPEVTPARVEQWKSPGRLAALAVAWRHAPPPGQAGAELAAELEAWRRQDRHLWEIGAHTRNQVTGRRDDAWRKVAAWLASCASVLVVDDSDMRGLRRRPADDDDDPVLPGTVQRKARARAALAAPGRLRQLAAAAAARDGLGVREVKAALLSRTCPRCGHVSEAGQQFAAASMVTCGGCGKGYDQDFAAVRVMLDRASAPEED